MIHRFKENTVYGGETLFGGCGCLERNKIVILKRTKGWLVYKQQFHNKILKTRRQYARVGATVWSPLSTSSTPIAWNRLSNRSEIGKHLGKPPLATAVFSRSGCINNRFFRQAIPDVFTCQSGSRFRRQLFQKTIVLGSFHPDTSPSARPCPNRS